MRSPTSPSPACSGSPTRRCRRSIARTLWWIAAEGQKTQSEGRRVTTAIETVSRNVATHSCRKDLRSVLNDRQARHRPVELLVSDSKHNAFADFRWGRALGDPKCHSWPEPCFQTCAHSIARAADFARAVNTKRARPTFAIHPIHTIRDTMQHGGFAPARATSLPAWPYAVLENTSHCDSTMGSSYPPKSRVSRAGSQVMRTRSLVWLYSSRQLCPFPSLHVS